MAIPSQYRTDNLFILVGTNPLPNFVAARLLLKPGGMVYLIHSDVTDDTAKRLITLFSRNDIGRAQRILVRSGEPDMIYTEVKRAAGSAISQGSVGLNYTGGTKPMAVHAHRALEEAVREARASAIFSYLDANDLNMVIDPIGTAKGQRFPVSMAVQPSLSDLLYLHRIELIPSRPLKQALLPETASALAALHGTQEGIGAWAEWCCGLRKKDRPDRFKSTGALKDIQLPADGKLSIVAEALQIELEIDAERLTLGDIVPKSPWADRKSKDAVESIAKWLDGVWLEHYTFAQLEKIAAEQHLHPEGMGIGLDTDPGKSPYDFEVDVAAMRGYQLFAISCTRDRRNRLCKSKLLEAYTRAKQLGGEEARVGLVSCHGNPAIVQKEVEDAWGAKDRVRVFGYRDMPYLSEELAQWFESTT